MNQVVLRGRRLFVFGLFALAVGLQISVCRADLVVAPGWDLYITPVTNIGGTDFVGDPLVNFDFGGGSQAVGSTDTIFQRTFVGPNTFLQIQALQLKTTGPVNGPSGNGIYYATLSNFLGSQPLAAETINFTNDTGGTFTANVQVNYALHFGSPGAPEIASTRDTRFINFNTTWGRLRPAIATAGPEINDINFTLKADNTTAQDFWAGGSIAAVPEPSLALTTFVSIAGIGLVSLKRRFRKKNEEAGETQAV